MDSLFCFFFLLFFVRHFPLTTPQQCIRRCIPTTKMAARPYHFRSSIEAQIHIPQRSGAFLGLRESGRETTELSSHVRGLESSVLATMFAKGREFSRERGDQHSGTRGESLAFLFSPVRLRFSPCRSVRRTERNAGDANSTARTSRTFDTTIIVAIHAWFSGFRSISPGSAATSSRRLFHSLRRRRATRDAPRERVRQVNSFARVSYVRVRRENRSPSRETFHIVFYRIIYNWKYSLAQSSCILTKWKNGILSEFHGLSPLDRHCTSDKRKKEQRKERSLTTSRGSCSRN